MNPGNFVEAAFLSLTQLRDRNRGRANQLFICQYNQLVSVSGDYSPDSQTTIPQRFEDNRLPPVKINTWLGCVSWKGRIFLLRFFGSLRFKIEIKYLFAKMPTTS